MKIKKIIIPLAVIAAGLMLGAIFSSKFPNITDRTTTEISETTQTTASNNNFDTQENGEGIEAILEIDKSSIQAYDENAVDFTTELDKIDKAQLNVIYQNNTDEILTGLKLWIDTEDPNQLDYSDTNTATANIEDITSSGRRVYDITNINPGERIGAHVWVFGKNPGTYTFTAEITSEQNNVKSNKTNEVTLTIE